MIPSVAEGNERQGEYRYGTGRPATPNIVADRPRYQTDRAGGTFDRILRFPAGTNAGYHCSRSVFVTPRLGALAA